MREKIIRYKTVSIPKKPDCVEFALKMLFIWNGKYLVNLDGAQTAHNKHMQYNPEQGSCVKQTLLFSEDYMKEKNFNLTIPVQFSDDTKNSFSGYYFMYFNFSDLSNHVEAVQIEYASKGNGSECTVVQNTRGEPNMTITKFIDSAEKDFRKRGDACKKVLLFKFQLNK